MTLTRKIFSGLAALMAVGLLSLAITLSHDAPCGVAPALPDDTQVMKAVVYRCYGSPDVLKVENIEKPVPADNEVLVKVRAASVNPFDWHYMTGTPYVMRLDTGVGRPTSPRLGVDFAGTVEAVGKNVTRFRPGDDVFGGKGGAFAEYVDVREDRIALKPANVTFEQAGSVYIAALTALQGLRDKGHVQPGQKVLINGASGGVGTFAVQIAKSYGAEVTGVCSTRNVELVRSIGADHVIDYKKEDFTKGAQRYDVIFDNVGNHPLLAYRRVMTPKGVYIMIGGPKTNKFTGPLGKAAAAYMLAPFLSQDFTLHMSTAKPDDMTILRDLMQSGKVTPVIDRTYAFDELPQAMRYLGEGHARGKIIIKL